MNPILFPLQVPDIDQQVIDTLEAKIDLSIRTADSIDLKVSILLAMYGVAFGALVNLGTSMFNAVAVVFLMLAFILSVVALWPKPFKAVPDPGKYVAAFSDPHDLRPPEVKRRESNYTLAVNLVDAFETNRRHLHTKLNFFRWSVGCGLVGILLICAAICKTNIAGGETKMTDTGNTKPASQTASSTQTSQTQQGSSTQASEPRTVPNWQTTLEKGVTSKTLETKK